MLGLVLTATAAARAAERKPDDDPRWPNFAVDDPQWPNLRLDDIDAPRLNRRPAFTDPQEVEDSIMGRKRSPVPKPSTASKPTPEPNSTPAASGLDANASVAARWPTFPPEKQRSPFVFEAGARYWYSTGSMKFGFANGSPAYGNPTSTLDWHGLSAHSGEVFARIDHVQSGVFVKGMFGLGTGDGGHIDDRDFFAGQLKFSDTTSDVHNGSLSFAMFDVGWAYSPLANLRLGFFVGYHYWHEKATAFGLICNQTVFLSCPFNGAVVLGFDTAVGSYEPTWHAVRIGAESRIMIDDRWSVRGEIAGVPYAALTNKDSHLLRADLGPVPNIISTSKYAYGVETELFVNYAVTPNIEVGAGVRYWGLASRNGGVRFGPSFAVSDSLNNFDQQRYGVLLQAKGKF